MKAVMLSSRRTFLGGLGAAAALPFLPRAEAASTKAYVQFCINVHDWGHADESAELMTRLATMFKKYKVKGDFYVNGFMAEKFQNNSSAISAIQSMTLSYAIRPPHPLYKGFNGPLEGKEGDDLENLIRDYETYDINMSDGTLNKQRAGGYALSKQVFGKAPTACTALISDNTLKKAAMKVYKSLGAKVVVAFHEEESDKNDPWEKRGDMIVRPSHIGLTKFTNGKQWWNTVAQGEGGDPLTELKSRINGWSGSTPFVTALIHDNNFYRFGPESWTLMYYKDKGKDTPRSAPYDTSAGDQSRARTTKEQNAIWSAYEELVDWAAQNCKVVTSEDLVKLYPG
jgi:hypothetical protein